MIEIRIYNDVNLIPSKQALDLVFLPNIIDDIRLSTRPDCINDEILTMLKEYRVSIIELGVQSLDHRVLIDSVRGHSDEDVFKSANLIKSYGIKLGLQMMTGLPSDTEEKCINTAKEFIKLNPDCVRIYPTLVVKDTGLEMLLKEGKYTPFTLEECISIVKKLLVLFYVNNIIFENLKIQRKTRC